MRSLARHLFVGADELLRCSGRFAVGRGPLAAGAYGLLLLAFGGLFGACMGSYAGRPLQVAFSALKVPLLLGLSGALCLPSLVALNLALGLREDASAVLRGVFAAQGTVAVCVAALAPLTLVAYASGAGYAAAVVVNGGLFAVAALAGQVTLWRHWRPLAARDRRHWAGWGVWLVLYVFVAVQLAWMLRPFVGDPGLATTFLRAESWSNAYVVVGWEVWRVMGFGG